MGNDSLVLHDIHLCADVCRRDDAVERQRGEHPVRRGPLLWSAGNEARGMAPVLPSRHRVGVTEDQLKGAPKYNRNTEWDWSDRRRDKTIYDYYRAPLWYA